MHIFILPLFILPKLDLNRKRDSLREVGGSKEEVSSIFSIKKINILHFFLILPTFSVFKIVMTQIQNPSKNLLFSVFKIILIISFKIINAKENLKASAIGHSLFNLVCNAISTLTFVYLFLILRSNDDLLTTYFMFCF